MNRKNVAVAVVQMSSAHQSNDVRVFAKESSSLAAAGYRVNLVIRNAGNRMREGVELVPIPEPKGRFRRMIFSPLAVLSRVLRTGARICHFHDPELIPVGFILKCLGKRVIYDVHEDLPRQILSKHWIPRYIRKSVSVIAEMMEWLAGRIFDRIVCATPTIARRFPKDRTVLVQNYPLENELIANISQPYSSRPMVVTYVGALSFERGALEMVAAIGSVSAEFNVRFDIAGYVTPESLLEKMRVHSGFARVNMLGMVSREKVAELLGCSRVGLVLFHPAENHVNAQPNKLFEYMSAGVPVIASDFPLWREIVGTVGAGILVDPLDPIQISNAITWIFTHPQEAERMGQRGMQAVKDKFNWRAEESKLLAMYEELV